MQLEPQALIGFLLRLIQLHNQEHMNEAFLSVEARGHHAATYKSKWQLGIASLTSSLAAFWATSLSTKFMSNQRGVAGVIWAKSQENWPPRVLQTLSINDR